MPAVARKTDRGVIHGGPYTIVSGSNDVFINSLPAARKGDRSSKHQGHITQITGGSDSVFVNNMPLARVTDKLGPACTQVASGSPDVYAG